MAKYQQRCFKCRKNFVLMSWGQRYAVCYDCQKDELNVEIKNKKMHKLFNIPEECYRTNAFLREIKRKYIIYGKLTEKQIDAFQKTAAEFTGDASKKAIPKKLA
jgi:hypothetical protein